MEAETQEQNKKELEIWNEGRRQITVTHLDGHSEVVTVRKIPLRRMVDMAKAQNDDTATALLYVQDQRDEQWLESLTDESKMAILEEGDAVNLPLFEKWWARRSRTMQRNGVDIEKVVAKAIEMAQRDPEASSGRTASAAS